MKRFAIVYQCGLANVFDVSHSGDMPEIGPFTDESKKMYKSRKRLLQGSFRDCEQYMRGAVASGKVESLIFHCDMAGDIALQNWEKGIGDMFAENKNYF
jgi:hypothetical protein